MPKKFEPPLVVIAGKEFPRVKWWKYKSLRKLYLLNISVLMLTSITNGFDGSMMNGLLALSFWRNYFNHPSPSTLGLLNAIFSVGQVAAIPFIPFFADRFGRKPTIIGGTMILFVGVAVQSASVSIGMFIGARFLIGFGVIFAQNCSPLLITELAHPQHRAILTTLYNVSWFYGAIIANWATFGTLTLKSDWAWRAPSMLQAFASVTQLCFIWFVPESPRYLIRQGREDKARAILEKFHMESSGEEFVETEYEEIVKTIELEKEFASRGIRELWASKGNRHRMVIAISAGVFSQTGGSAIINYYISIMLDKVGITDSRTQLIINGCLTIWGYLVATTFSLQVERFGRRPLFLIATIGETLAMLGWSVASARSIITGSATPGYVMIAMLFVFQFFHDFAWSGLLIGYTVEILPYSIRSKGMSVMLMSVALGLFFSNYVNPIGIAAISWKFYICYLVWLTIQCFVVYFFYIETKNTTLEEIAKHFDGENALVGGPAATERARELEEKLAGDKVQEVIIEDVKV
ncbi:Lactose permease [Hyphodiscus hymeniophilus]|uniref:Lactose permease n=1 Tax=Hyphodiscus hymeniophilus TaxID=353542 RepID=A0A9P6VH39_9HELO|nr:Lactose permease [Hyphodiscus hymeniophilus]